VAHDREQHVAEVPRDVRSDGLLDERGDQAGDPAMTGGNREMIGPEPNQALPERSGRGHGGSHCGLGTAAVERAGLGLAWERVVLTIVFEGFESFELRG
jgi:hypothetical protein